MYDVIVVWLGTRMLRPGMRTSSILNTQHPPSNQHAATHHNSGGWPDARNMLRPTMLRYDLFKCWDHLA